MDPVTLGGEAHRVLTGTAAQFEDCHRRRTENPPFEVAPHDLPLGTPYAAVGEGAVVTLGDRVKGGHPADSRRRRRRWSTALAGAKYPVRTADLNNLRLACHGRRSNATRLAQPLAAWKRLWT